MGDRPWTTPSELGEYAFCPRAREYRRTGPQPASPSADDGTVYHARRLGAERWRDEHVAVPWIVVAVGLGLVAAAIAVGAR